MTLIVLVKHIVKAATMPNRTPVKMTPITIKTKQNKTKFLLSQANCPVLW